MKYYENYSFHLEEARIVAFEFLLMQQLKSERIPT